MMTFFNGMKLSAYPNPTVDNVTIEYALDKAVNNVTLNVFNEAGQEVLVKSYSSQTAGVYKVNVETTEFAAGNYFYQLNANGYNFTKKFVVTK